MNDDIISEIIGQKERCNNKAEWKLTESDPLDYTFTCAEHLSLMISPQTSKIDDTKDDNERCCFITADNIGNYCTCRKPKANHNYFGPHHGIDCPLFQKEYQK